MKPINEAVVALIEKAMSGVDTAIGFLQDEIPEVIKQLLLWEFTYSFIYFAFSITLIIGSVLFLIYQYKYWMSIVEEDNHIKRLRIAGETGPLSTLNIAVLIPLCIGFDIMQFTWLKIWIAPKVFLIEYSANLIK